MDQSEARNRERVGGTGWKEGSNGAGCDPNDETSFGSSVDATCARPCAHRSCRGTIASPRENKCSSLYNRHFIACQHPLSAGINGTVPTRPLFASVQYRTRICGVSLPTPRLAAIVGRLATASSIPFPSDPIRAAMAFLPRRSCVRYILSSCGCRATERQVRHTLIRDASEPCTAIGLDRHVHRRTRMAHLRNHCVRKEFLLHPGFTDPEKKLSELYG